MKTSGDLVRSAIAPALAGLVAGLMAGSAAPAWAQSIDELYAAAKKEGALTLYGGGPADFYERWIKAFEERFPGIKVTLTADFSNILAPLVDRQIADGKLTVDLTVLQTLQDFDRWNRQGVLMTFKPDGWDQIDASFKDPDGRFVGVSVNAVSYAYNTKAVDAARVPHDAPDFLKPEFKGRVITCYPHDDDITLYLFYTIVQKYGWDFMDRYMANEPKWIRGHLGVARAIAGADADVSFDATINTSLGLKRRGQPTDVAFPATDPMPVWAQTTAVFKDAPHPNAAKLYVTWFLAREQQSRIGTWSVRRDVPPPDGLKPIFDYPLANGYRGFVTNTSLVGDLRKRFEDTIGKPQGQPVIR
jgi:ABC-type Fe3+ transport system substrate-binding protein